MTKPDIHPIARIIRYGVSGVTISLFFSLAVIGFVRLSPRIGPVGATVLAFCVVQPIGYVIHRVVTFPDAAVGGARTRASLLRFFATNIGSLALATGGMAIVTGVLKASYLWGVALNWMLLPAINFTIYLFWVFKIRSGPGRTPA